jgi:hypothetical protein
MDTPAPYRELLKIAGCEFGDLRRLVEMDGLEGALGSLFRRGVYLTVDEFKGHCPIVRGSATLATNTAGLRNPASRTHALARSGASRSRGTSVPIDLAFMREQAANACLGVTAWNGFGWPKALWAVPGGGALILLLQYSGFGRPMARWFSHVDPASPGLDPRYRWSARMVRWASLAVGVPLPEPRLAPLNEPLLIARWMATVLRSGGTPLLLGFASSVATFCRAAEAAGLDLHGARFLLVGEPVTARRLAAVRAAGAEAIPNFGAAEVGGGIALGCARAEQPDDCHQVDDLHAVIQPGSSDGEVSMPANALLLTSLSPLAPLVLFNVSLGDQAEAENRSCGCPLEAVGWNNHLHTIRSFEKLTAAGMTFFDSDVIRVLEDVLPARFGGELADYQLVEREAEDGSPRLRLLVHPVVGPLDSDLVVETFLSAIGGGSGTKRVMELQWRAAQVLEVERRPPVSTRTGKILHLARDRTVPTLKRGATQDEATRAGLGNPSGGVG